MQFCTNCENLLDIDPNVKGMFCPSCRKMYPLNTNIIMEEHIELSSKKQFEADHKAMLYDDTYPTVIKKCPHCTNTVIHFMRKPDMTVTYVCRKCKHYW